MSILFSTADAARRLDVTPATIRAWERRGVLKAQKTLSGTRVFDAAEVERVASERDAERGQRG